MSVMHVKSDLQRTFLLKSGQYVVEHCWLKVKHLIAICSLAGSDKDLVVVPWQMENYFQAEAYNLDKVLDEFEQNEGESFQTGL